MSLAEQFEKRLPENSTFNTAAQYIIIGDFVFANKDAILAALRGSPESHEGE